MYSDSNEDNTSVENDDVVVDSDDDDDGSSKCTLHSYSLISRITCLSLVTIFNFIPWYRSLVMDLMFITVDDDDVDVDGVALI